MTHIDFMRSMTESQRLLFQTEFMQRRKSTTVAVLLGLLGPIGAHRFYLGQIGRGLWYLGLSCTFVGLVITIPLAIIDFFRMSSLTAVVNGRIAEDVAAEILSLDAPGPGRSAPGGQ